MDLNIIRYTSAVLLALGLCNPASANFSGQFDVSHWTTTDNASGSVDVSNAPAYITLTSGNAGIGGDTFFTITANIAETVSFDWSYTTNDLWGESGTDAFGYVLNGTTTTLINPNQDFSNPNQLGTATFSVNAGDIFGFDANTLDGYYGSSVTVISNFSAVPVAAVPELPSLWLMIFGLLGITGAQRQRRQA